MIESRKTRALRELDEKVEKMTKMYLYSRIGTFILLVTPLLLMPFDIRVLDVFNDLPIGLTVLQIYFIFAIVINATERELLSIVKLMQKINSEET